MKPIVRNILIIGALAAVGFSLYAKSKIDTAMSLFEKISIKPKSFPKNIKLTNPNAIGIPQTISFNIDLLIINTAAQDFSVSGYGIATLQSVSIYWKDQLIGTANLQLDSIEIPAGSSFALNNVFFQGETLSILSNLQAFTNLTLADLKFTATLEIAGISYEIGN